MIRTSNLAVGFKNGFQTPTILHSHINVVLSQGEFACLLGPNGAGKSSLIKTISGYLAPLDGEIYIANNQLSSYSKKELSKIISIVFTERIKVPNMTVKELVSLGRAPYTDFLGRLLQKDEKIVVDAMNEIGIGHLSHRYITTLSDGELQKTMIAKALAQETPIIILDEPTAFLDLPSRLDIMNLLRRLAKEKGKAILLSTHDLDMALRMADKVWLLDKGKKLAMGTPEDLVLNDDFRRFFEKDGILFDNESGAFNTDKANLKTIRLIGQGIEFKWVQRALNRNGFDTTPTEGDYMNIEITSNEQREYTLTHPLGKTQQFRTIEDLLNSVNEEG